MGSAHGARGLIRGVALDQAVGGALAGVGRAGRVAWRVVLDGRFTPAGEPTIEAPGPFHGTNLLDDEAEWNALVYVCLHGVKEGFVVDPARWPLANTVAALRGGGDIEGLFPDRADPSRLRPVRAKLTPLSRWPSDVVAYQGRCVDMLEDLTARAIAHGVGHTPQRRVMNHLHVPEAAKRSRARTFRAAGELKAVLEREAYEARREAVDAAIISARVLMLHGVAEAELPDCCQWPPFVSEALEEGFAECTFAEVYAPDTPSGR